MQLDRIVEGNRRYAAGRKPRPLPAPEKAPLVVVACFDPRLDDMLVPALGLEPGEAFLFRTAGAFVPPGSSTLRALMVGIFLLDARELLVVGHTSCRMAAFETADFIAAFRSRGVPREAFGTEDLREWAGAIPSPRRGVELCVDHIVSDPARPHDLSVSGLVLDDTTGALEIVVQPGESVPDVEPAEPEPSEPEVPPLPEEKDTTAPSDSLVEAVDALAGIIRSNKKWRYEVGRLRDKLHHEGNPLAKLNLLTDFVHRVGADSREMRRAFERLTNEAASSDRKLEAKDLFPLFERLVAKL